MFRYQSIPGWKVFSTSKVSHQGKKQSSCLFFKRHYSTGKPNAWSYVTSPYRVSDVLMGKKSLPTGLHFTITNPNYITRSLDDLKTIFAAIGSTGHNEHPYRYPRKIIVFKPQRKAKQQLAAIVAGEIKIEDDHHFVHVCSRLNHVVQQAVADHHKTYKEMEREIENSVYEAIHSSSASRNKIREQYLEIIDAIHSRTLSFSPAIITSTATKIIMDDLLRDSIESTTYSIVVDVVSDQVKKQHLTSLNSVSEQDRQQIMLMLPQFSADKRLMQVMAGGPASGKSMTTKQFAAKMKTEYELNLSDFAFISTDRFRLFLLKDDESIGTDIALRSLHTQDEARMITEETLRLITKKLTLTGYAPNIFMETVCPIDEEIQMGTQAGCKLRVSLTSYPPEKAVEGNYQRYLSTQERLPPVSAVLGGQQLVSRETPKILAKHSGKDIVMTLYNTYALLHESGEKNALIAAFHCEQDKIIIRDIKGMLDFIKKSHINPVATSTEAIYLSPRKITQDALITDFLKEYGNKEILFIDPSAKDIDYDTVSHHLYAIYSHEKGLVIKNKELFNSLVTRDPVSKLLFDQLKFKQEMLESYRMSKV